MQFDTYSHIVELDKVTREVGQKYFSAHPVLSIGITLEMKHVMETKTVILKISGKKKSHIVKRMLETNLNNSFPASLVKKHPNAFLLLDSDVAKA